jgi:hypothetical protein
MTPPVKRDVGFYIALAQEKTDAQKIADFLKTKAIMRSSAA